MEFLILNFEGHSRLCFLWIWKYIIISLNFSGDKNKKVAFDHRDINDELNYVSNSWNLDENTAMLHSLSMYHTFGLVATLMTPLSVGGSVTILPEFDTLKVRLSIK